MVMKRVLVGKLIYRGDVVTGGGDAATRPRYPTGHHPLPAACDNTGEPLAWMLRP